MAAGTCRGGGSRHARQSNYMALNLCMFLAAALLAWPCMAAVQLDGNGTAEAPAAGSGNDAGTAITMPQQPLWQRYEAMFPAGRLAPVVTSMRGHEVVYQIPDRPTATLFIAPGCSHAAHDWWPQSKACPDCLGLPEEMAHTQQALARGYAVLSMSSKSVHGDMCIDWSTNYKDAVAIINAFLKQQGLDGLPLYGLGVSVGGGFVAKLAAHVHMAGVVAEVLGPRTLQWDLDCYKFGIPPIVFVSMDQDPSMAARISADSTRLRQHGATPATVRVAPRVVYPTFFSDRSPRVSPEVSAKVVAALHQINMLDERGMVTVDPRHTKQPWVKQLVELVPELDGGMTEDHSQVWEEMNLAWSSHEIISDFATAAFAWFEGGAKADFAELVERYAPPGHTGLVGDAAGAIPPLAETGAARGSASAPPAMSGAQHMYAVHEAMVQAIEAETTAHARVSLPVNLQGEVQHAAGAAAVIQPHSSANQAQRASSLRVLGTTAQQKPASQLHLPGQRQQQHPQASAMVSAASLLATEPQLAAQADSALSAAGAEVQPAHLDAAPAPAAPDAAAADAGSSSGSGLTPVAILGGIGGAVAVVALLSTLYQAARKPAGFAALPVTEPCGSHGCLLAKASAKLPVSMSAARLPPIPEIPESPTNMA